MALLEKMRQHEAQSQAAASISADKLLRGDTDDALAFAFSAQRHRAEARECHDTLAISAGTSR